MTRSGSGLLRAAFATGSLALSISCVGFDPDAETVAENASDVVDLSTKVSALAAAFVPAGTSTLDVSTLAPNLTLFVPPSCASSTVVDGTLSVTLVRCAGPWGLVDVTGKVMVGPGVAPAPGVRALAISAEGLAFGPATVSFAATGTLGESSSVRTMTWSPDLRGTTARGQAFETSSASTLLWGPGGRCLDFISATATAAVGGASLAIQTVGVERCSLACIGSGVLTASNGGSVADWLAFDGSDVAMFGSASGENFVELACGL